MTNALGWGKKVKFEKRIPDPLFDLGACISSTLSVLKENILARLLTRPECACF